MFKRREEESKDSRHFLPQPHVIEDYSEVRKRIPPFKYMTPAEVIEEVRIQGDEFTYSCIDTETTGMLGGTNRIVQLGEVTASLQDTPSTDLVAWNGCEYRLLTNFNPQRRMDHKATEVNGLYLADLVAYPVLDAKWFNSRRPWGIDPVLMWNAPFDAHFVAAEMVRAGATDALKHFCGLKFIDVKVLANQLLPEAPRSLGEFAKFVGIQFEESILHNALVDATLTAMVFARLVRMELTQGSG